MPTSRKSRAELADENEELRATRSGASRAAGSTRGQHGDASASPPFPHLDLGGATTRPSIRPRGMGTDVHSVPDLIAS